MKKILAMLVTATVIGAGGLAVASAAVTPSVSASTSASAATKPTAKSAAKSDLTNNVGVKLRKLAFTTAASTIGITPAELRSQMTGGHSVADVATSHSVDPQTVIKAVEDAIDARVQQAVTNHKITQAQATAIDQFVAARVPKLVNATPKQLVRMRLIAGAIDVSAKTIGVSSQSLRQSLVAGQSVADVATAHNVTPATVVAALVKAGNARIATALANHHIDTARADKLKARLPQVAQQFVAFKRTPAQQPSTVS